MGEGKKDYDDDDKVTLQAMLMMILMTTILSPATHSRLRNSHRTVYKFAVIT